MREIVAATLCAPLAVILLNGCAGPVTEADRQLASKFDHELYLAGRNTPAEYAVNQMCSNVLNTMLLKEELAPFMADSDEKRKEQGRKEVYCVSCTQFMQFDPTMESPCHFAESHGSAIDFLGDSCPPVGLALKRKNV